jgi:Uma2 family endonuclease
MTYTPTKVLTFDEFIDRYGDNPHYELIDGELRDVEPTGPHEAVTGRIIGYIFVEILRANYNWIAPKNCLVKPPAMMATALRPDAIVLDEDKLSQEPLWKKEPIICLVKVLHLGKPQDRTFRCNGSTIKLVVEVVSTNWQDDYARKMEEYALLAIPEYWIIDYLGIGGIAFIGKPKQPTFTVCQLAGDSYIQQQFRLGESILSPTFPDLKLRLNDLLPRLA